MSQITITIDDSEVRDMLLRTPQALRRATANAMQDSTIYLLRQMKTYPSARAQSSYRRTGTLRRSWSRRITSISPTRISGIVGSNRNMAAYNRYVQDSEMQARIHRGLWTNTVQGVRDRSQSQVSDYFRLRLKQELG